MWQTMRSAACRRHGRRGRGTPGGPRAAGVLLPLVPVALAACRTPAARAPGRAEAAGADAGRADAAPFPAVARRSARRTRVGPRFGDAGPHESSGLAASLRAPGCSGPSTTAAARPT
jgi:hypothetical protein